MRSARRKGCGVSASAIAVSSGSSAVIARVRVARRAAVTHSLVAMPKTATGFEIYSRDLIPTDSLYWQRTISCILLREGYNMWE
jgi:hypothetical protein